MNEPNLLARPESIYRVDKFNVPKAARGEFLERVLSINRFLRTLPGFVQDLVLEQTGGPGRFNLITIVIWDSAQAMASARQQTEQHYRETGFKPAELLERLGIEADMGNYELHRTTV